MLCSLWVPSRVSLEGPAEEVLRAELYFRLETEKVNVEREYFLKDNNAKGLETTNWTTHEWLHFLRKMPKPLLTKQMQSLDEEYHFTNAKNSEISDLWFIMAVAANYEPAFPAMDKFLSVTGRQKFILPLYEEMTKTGKSEMANSIYKKYRANYHPLAQSKLDKILQ